MNRSQQYKNLMSLVHTNGMIETQQGLLDYVALYQRPIQIGTRLGDLVRSGYLESTILEKNRAIYTLTQKGIDWNVGDIIVVKTYKSEKKLRSSQEESIIKQECKLIDKEATKIEPTTLRTKFLSFFK